MGWGGVKVMQEGVEEELWLEWNKKNSIKKELKSFHFIEHCQENKFYLKISVFAELIHWDIMCD